MKALVTGVMGKAQRLGKRNGRPLRFLMAGVVNTMFGFAFYPALLWSTPWFHLHYMIALGIAQAVCLLFAFGVYKIGVFRNDGGGPVRQFATFSSFYLVNYLLNWLALPLLVEGLGLAPITGQLLFGGLLVIGSYFWHSRVTFRPVTK
jgi:putative flippase GtrA